MDHAVTGVMGHHDGWVDAQLFLFSPRENQCPCVPPRHHEGQVSIRAQAHSIVGYVVEDTVVSSSHCRKGGAGVREGVRHDGSTWIPVDMMELAASRVMRGSKFIGALEHGAGALEQLEVGTSPNTHRHGVREQHSQHQHSQHAIQHQWRSHHRPFLETLS